MLAKYDFCNEKRPNYEKPDEKENLQGNHNHKGLIRKMVSRN